MVGIEDREPYVGSGEDGCRRSARIDREQVDGLAWDDPRAVELTTSAQAWEEQAFRLMLQRLGPRPSLAQLRTEVGSEEWLAALALLDLSFPVADDAARYASWSRDGGRFTYVGEGEDQVATFHPNPEMNWDAWVTDVDEAGRTWSSTESRLFQLVAALTVPGRTVRLVGVLDQLGSWEPDVLSVLVQWASGGNNREYPGRSRVIGDPA